MNKIRFTYSKSKLALYLTNDEVEIFIKKALKKSNIKFDEKKKIVEFALTVELGMESTGEVGVITLKDEVSIPYFMKALNDNLPEGLTILSAKYEEPLNLVKLNKRVSSSDYQIQFNHTKELLENKTQTEINLLEKDYEAKMKEYLSNNEVLVTKKSKGRMEKIDIKPNILDYSYEFNTLNVRLSNNEAIDVNPETLMEGFSEYIDDKVYFNAKRTRINID